jgi:hypothetical protein
MGANDTSHVVRQSCNLETSWDNVLPVYCFRFLLKAALCPRFSLMAAFADNVVPVMSVSLRTAAFADNVLPVLSPFSLMAAFADNVVPVLSLFFTDSSMCGKCGTIIVPVFHTQRHLRITWYQYCPRFSLTASFADNVEAVLSRFLLTVAFADNVLRVLCPFFTRRHLQIM